ASERQPVKNRQNDECGDAASGKESDLKDAIVRERKAIQPLHAQSRISALGGRDQKLFTLCLPDEDGFACARDPKSPGSSTSRPAAPPRAPNPFRRTPVIPLITKRDPVENWGVRRTFAEVWRAPPRHRARPMIAHEADGDSGAFVNSCRRQCPCG